MLKQLRIKNFKAFADTGDIELRPLTFLMGPNSSGKTSILQVLLLIRQTVDSRDVENPLLVNGSYVTLGAYQEFVHRHEISANFAFALTLSATGILRLMPTLSSGTRRDIPAEGAHPRARRYNSISVSSSFSYDLEHDQIQIKEVTTKTEPEVVVFELKRDAQNEYSQRLLIEEREIPMRPQEFQDIPRKFYYSPVGRSFTLPEDASGARYLPVGFSSDREFERTFRQTFYIGPIREPFQRFYIASGERPQDVGLRGEFAMQVLWSTSRDKQVGPQLQANVDRWLKEFDIAAAVQLRPLEANLFYLSVIDPHTGISVNIADVGFGASQVLPVIVEGFYSQPQSTILLEQPEIHLHPKAQAVLGDLLIDIAKKDKTLIVETHSEHLISRIQRRIAEGSFNKEDVALYYCQPSQEGTQLRRIPFNDLGQFDTGGQWPEGFFDTDYNESFAHSQAMAERVKKTRPN